MVKCMGEIKIRTLTPLWTGDVDRECKSIKETGIIGSLRWWYEALVRGLGGYACDPTSDRKCELKQDKFNEAIKSGKSIQGALDEQICPACQLFGCTGWSRKFRVEITVEEVFRADPSQGFEGILKLHLLEIKTIREEEKWLLKKIFEIIGKYGSIGGRTTRKPQRSETIGKDYGLISVENIEIETKASKNDVESWLLHNKRKLSPKNNNEEWPNFKFFFFVQNKFLWRSQMKKLMEEIPFLHGQKRTKDSPGKSKRIFSFKAGRIWGYAKNDEMLKEIENKLREMNISGVIRGEKVLK